MYKGLNKNISTWMSMPTYRYIHVKSGKVMDVKFEPDNDNGWAVCGNDWSNLYRGLEFPVSQFELTKDGWEKI